MEGEDSPSTSPQQMVKIGGIMIEELENLDARVIRDGLSEATQEEILTTLKDDEVWAALIGRLCRVPNSQV